MQSCTPTDSATDYVIRDQQGDPLGYVQSGTGYAYATNDIGSVTNVVNSSGATAASYTYDPYGHLNSSTGPDAADNLIGHEGILDSDSNCGIRAVVAGAVLLSVFAAGIPVALWRHKNIEKREPTCFSPRVFIIIPG